MYIYTYMYIYIYTQTHKSGLSKRRCLPPPLNPDVHPPLPSPPGIHTLPPPVLSGAHRGGVWDADGARGLRDDAGQVHLPRLGQDHGTAQHRGTACNIYYIYKYIHRYTFMYIYIYTYNTGQVHLPRLGQDRGTAQHRGSYIIYIHIYIDIHLCIYIYT